MGKKYISVKEILTTSRGLETGREIITAGKEFVMQMTSPVPDHSRRVILEHRARSPNQGRKKRAWN